MGKEGVDEHISGIFYLAVVQSILIFGSETQVVTPHNSKILRGFPPPGHKADHRKETSATSRWKLVILLPSGGDVRGRVRGTGKLYFQKS